MDLAGALGESAEKLGVVVAVAAAAGALLLPDARRRAFLMILALLVTAAVLVGHIWDSDQFRSISGDPPAFGASLLFAAALTAGLGALFVREPALFPLLAVAALPFRVPIEAGGSTTNLLVPLYLVIAGATAAYAWRQLSTYEPDRRRTSGLLELAIAIFLALFALQALYSRDFDQSLEQVAFFYVPFALLFCQLREVRWTRPLLIGCAGILVGLALTFSLIGFWEYDHRELLWNPKVINANQFESYFRVNSVFWDPNVYGRFLALVMVTVAAVALWSRDLRVIVGAAGVLCVLWGGLVLTFSQSSFASLLAGLAVLAALRWDPRRTLAVCAIGAALAIVFVLAFQSALRLNLGSSSGLNKATSGRVDLVEGGAELFADKPLWGQGAGAFARAYRQERKGNQQQATSASHTLPVTVAAEQGLIGLASYLFLLFAAFGLLLGGRGIRGPPPGASGDGALRADDLAAYPAARAAIAAGFTTLVVHTMMYAAFLEDPFAWVLMGMGLAIVPYARLAEREVPAEAAPATAPALA